MTAPAPVLDLPFDLVLFDLDGTLVETALEITDAVNDTLAGDHGTGVSQAQVERWIGHGTRALLAQAVAQRRGVTVESVHVAPDFPALLSRFADAYAARCGTRSRLYPQVRQALDALRAAGVRLAVVTNKESRYTARVLEAHGLSGCFDAVVSGDTLPVKKPDPGPVDHCRAVCGAAPHRTLLVGDSAIDVATARQARVTVWAVPYGYNGGRPVIEANPDRLISDFGALMPAALRAWTHRS